MFGFTKALSKEVGQYRINVNCVSPALIKTPLSEIASKKGILDPIFARQSIKGWGEPEDIAMAVLFLVSEDSRNITGQSLNIDGGLFMPMP